MEKYTYFSNLKIFDKNKSDIFSTIPKNILRQLNIF